MRHERWVHHVEARAVGEAVAPRAVQQAALARAPMPRMAPPAKAATACRETPLAAADVAAAARGVAGAYAGATPTAWFDAHADSAAVPGASCSTFDTEMGSLDMGMLCFEAACAPPSVAAFECGEV